MSLFSQLGVPADLVRGLDALGISTPTPIQQSAILFLIRNGGNLVAQAQTGTGKTAAFGLPLLTKIDPADPALQGLVLSPTRELAKQIGKHLFQYTKFSKEKIFVEVTGGGDKIDLQVQRLQRPTHIVVATPGRLFDWLKLGPLRLDSVKHLVLDEADEMLSMGFRKEVVRVAELTASRRSTWLFSATFPEKLQRLIVECMPADRASCGSVHFSVSRVATSRHSDPSRSLFRHGCARRRVVACSRLIRWWTICASRAPSHSARSPVMMRAISPAPAAARTGEPAPTSGFSQGGSS